MKRCTVEQFYKVVRQQSSGAVEDFMAHRCRWLFLGVVNHRLCSRRCQDLLTLWCMR